MRIRASLRSVLERSLAEFEVRRKSSGSGTFKRGRCTPSIWVDGAPITFSDDLEFMVPADFVRAVEVYSSAMTAPAQFTGWSTCGVIVFWTGARK